jgi:hypothetical protein
MPYCKLRVLFLLLISFLVRPKTVIAFSSNNLCLPYLFVLRDEMP